MGSKSDSKAGGVGNGGSAFDLEVLQQQLLQLSTEEGGTSDIMSLLNSVNKSKISAEERTVIMPPFNEVGVYCFATFGRSVDLTLSG